MNRFSIFDAIERTLIVFIYDKNEQMRTLQRVLIRLIEFEGIQFVYSENELMIAAPIHFGIYNQILV